MARKWSEVRRTLSPEAEERIRKSIKEAPGVMSLYQVREARSLTQVNLAKILNVNQGAVSRMERRTDVYVSTLRSFIEAMGGQLQIKAIFPGAEIEIDQFGSLPQLPEEFRDEAQNQDTAPESQSIQSDSVNASV
jgi:transcriptional regulator with XRE-family HTH domain